MVEVKKERSTDWRGVLKSFFGGSININSNNEEYKQWEEMNATYVKASNKSIKGLEEETSAHKNEKVLKIKRESSKKQTESLQKLTNDGKIGKDSIQRNDGERSR